MNTIKLANAYAKLLDETYMQTSKTAILESDSALVREGANANEIVIPILSMDGLANYDRNSGYVSGDVSLKWGTVEYNYERGRMFEVDAMDDEETQNIAFGRLAGEFVRTKVVPELDAFRFASLAEVAGSSVNGKLEDGESVIAAIRTAISQMDIDEVPSDDRVLFITPALIGMIEDLDTTKSKAVLAQFDKIITVPASRFYTGIELKDGVSDGETEGGYSNSGNAINFMVVHKPAVIQFTKHAAPKIITPEQNQTSDAWKYGYRSYGICDVYSNKAAGVYVHSVKA